MTRRDVANHDPEIVIISVFIKNHFNKQTFIESTLLLSLPFQEFEKRSSSTLIPINRLPIPNRPETQPLVEYKSDNSDDDDDGHTFFPVKLNGNKRIDMTDTFSLQEMTIESNTDDDDDDAQNLELRFADPNDSWLNKFKRWSCC